MSTSATPAPDDTRTTPLKRVRLGKDTTSNGSSGPQMDPKRAAYQIPTPAPVRERVYFHGWMTSTDTPRNRRLRAEMNALLERYELPGESSSFSVEIGPAPERLG